MASSFQPALRLSSSTAPVCRQHGSVVTGCYPHGSSLGEYAAAPDHAASMDVGLDYPHFLRFEDSEELSNNYLAAELARSLTEDNDVLHPDQPSSAAVAAAIYEMPLQNAYINDSGPVDELPSDAYPQWYIPYVVSPCIRNLPPHPSSAYPASTISPTALRTQRPPTYDPAICGAARVVQSTYSSIADALVSHPSPSDAGAQATRLPSNIAPIPAPTYHANPANDEHAAPHVAQPSRHTYPRSRDHSAASPPPHSVPDRDAFIKPKPLISTPRRNTAVAPGAISPVRSGNKWKCPYCDHEQSSRRSPDLLRHINTHTRGDEPLWVCCGVPLSDAHASGVPAAMAMEEPFEFQGRFLVGGCLKVFSRRDALGRHLRKYAGTCFGDEHAPWLPGNRQPPKRRA